MNDERRTPDEDVQGHFRPDEDEMFGDDTEGHAITPHGGRPGPGTNVGGRFRPNEEDMFGEDDVSGHAAPSEHPDGTEEPRDRGV